MPARYNCYSLTLPWFQCWKSVREAEITTRGKEAGLSKTNSAVYCLPRSSYAHKGTALAGLAPPESSLHRLQGVRQLYNRFSIKSGESIRHPKFQEALQDNDLPVCRVFRA